jgi:hypothetical protein
MTKMCSEHAEARLRERVFLELLQSLTDAGAGRDPNFDYDAWWRQYEKEHR